MAENLVKAPWVHVKGANSRTLQMIQDARNALSIKLINEGRDRTQVAALVANLAPAYIRGKATRSGNPVTTVWSAGKPHKAFASDMSAEVHFRARPVKQLELF